MILGTVEEALDAASLGCLAFKVGFFFVFGRGGRVKKNTKRHTATQLPKP